jgi:hypothetical protein
MVAYEMASELKRSYNETVAMVFMVDTFPWFPKALTNCTEYITKCGEENLKSTKKLEVNILPLKICYYCIHSSHCMRFDWLIAYDYILWKSGNLHILINSVFCWQITELCVA